MKVLACFISCFCPVLMLTKRQIIYIWKWVFLFWSDHQISNTQVSVNHKIDRYFCIIYYSILICYQSWLDPKANWPTTIPAVAKVGRRFQLANLAKKHAQFTKCDKMGQHGLHFWLEENDERQTIAEPQWLMNMEMSSATK